MGRLIIAGNTCVDIHIPPHQVPPSGVLSTIPAVNTQLGGDAVFTAVTAARLGTPTAMVGTLGDDLTGQLIRDRLKQERVDISRLQLLAGRTSPCRIVYEHNGGPPGFLLHAGTNADYRLSPLALEAPCKVFHFAAPEHLHGVWPAGAVEMVRKLKTRGRTVSVDIFAPVGNHSNAERLARDHYHLLELADLIFANEGEAKVVSGRAECQSVVSYFLERGAKIVVITRGAKGALVSSEGRTEEVRAARVQAVDRSGVGNSFVAGFLSGYLRGLDPWKCGRLGSIVAGLCLRGRGPLEGTANQALLRKALSNFRLQTARQR